MWHRDDAKPTKYGDTLFRSALEAKVAQQLDKLGVNWAYEQPVDGTTGYLPDFTITEAPEHLHLPRWVEVKPAELLYAVRDHLGHPERFEGTQTSTLDSTGMRDAQLTEVWKPKRLAEITGKAVLVVSAINRNRTLSILLLSDRIELSRAHPAVNHRQVLLDRERDEREAQWRAEADQRQAARDAEHRQWQQQVVAYVRTNGRAARFDGWCQICRQQRQAAALLIFQDTEGRWAAICRLHADHAPGKQPP